MLIWQTMCIVGTLKTYIANKIIIINVIEIKKFHMSTSISSIILKIHIKKFIFISFLFSLTFLVAKQCNKYKEMSFQAQNFLGISKALGTQSVISCLAPLPLLHNKTQQQQPFPFPQNLFTYTRHHFNCLSLIFPKMSSRPVLAFALDNNGDCTNPKNQSIS